jgi:hypothetical protein
MAYKGIGEVHLSLVASIHCGPVLQLKQMPTDAYSPPKVSPGYAVPSP